MKNEDKSDPITEQEHRYDQTAKNKYIFDMTVIILFWHE